MEHDDGLERKFVLLDTNILIALAKQGSTMKPFSDFLLAHNCVQITADAVRFELLGYAKNPQEYVDLNHWLKGFTVLPSLKEEVENATLISVMLRHKIPHLGKQISFTDFLLAAHLQKYGSKIVLATRDWHDFPTILFDRIKILTVDTEKDVLTITFIQFNEEKARDILADFIRSMPPLPG
jgi:predicted nucleic acid-binding protein